MKPSKIKKKLKKIKNIFAPKLSLSKISKKVKSNFDRTYKKLNTKKKKVKKFKKTRTSAQLKIQQKLREQIAKHKHREKLAKTQAIKIRNQEKQRLKDEELKIKKQELRLKEEDIKLKVAELRLKEQAEQRLQNQENRKKDEEKRIRLEQKR